MYLQTTIKLNLFKIFLIKEKSEFFFVGFSVIGTAIRTGAAAVAEIVYVKYLSAAVGKFYYPVCSVGANFRTEFANTVTFKATLAFGTFFAVCAKFSAFFKEGFILVFVVRNVFIIMAVCNFFAKFYIVYSILSIYAKKVNKLCL